MGYNGVMLSSDDYGGDMGRDTIMVFHGDLSFTVRSEIAYKFLLPDFRQALGQPVWKLSLSPTYNLLLPLFPFPGRRPRSYPDHLPWNPL